MGLKQDCLEATKELRKQFVKPKKAKKPSKHVKHDQRIIDAVEDYFSSNNEKGYRLCEALLNRKIARPIDQEVTKTFNGVKNSLVVYLMSGDTDGTEFVLDHTLNETLIRWSGKNNELFSWHRYKKDWRPATDKEIEKFFE